MAWQIIPLPIIAAMHPIKDYKQTNASLASVNMLLSINVDSLHWAQLVPGSVTTLGRVNHLDTS